MVLILSTGIHTNNFTRKQENQGGKERLITIDYKQVKGMMNVMFRKCIGAGRANEGLRADWQQQLIYVKEQCGFRYIRMHGLLSDDMGVYFEDKHGNPVYNWQYIDIVYDFLLSIDMKPFNIFGFMPAAMASENKTIFWWEEISLRQKITGDGIFKKEFPIRENDVYLVLLTKIFNQ